MSDDTTADVYADLALAGELRVHPRWGVFASLHGYRVAECDYVGRYRYPLVDGLTLQEAYTAVKLLRQAEGLEHI